MAFKMIYPIFKLIWTAKSVTTSVVWSQTNLEPAGTVFAYLSFNSKLQLNTAVATLTQSLILRSNPSMSSIFMKVFVACEMGFNQMEQ